MMMRMLHLLEARRNMLVQKDLRCLFLALLRFVSEKSEVGLGLKRDSRL